MDTQVPSSTSTTTLFPKQSAFMPQISSMYYIAVTTRFHFLHRFKNGLKRVLIIIIIVLAEVL